MKRLLLFLTLLGTYYSGLGQWDRILDNSQSVGNICLNNDTLYVAANDSLFVSSDGGTNWICRHDNFHSVYDLYIVEDILYWARPVQYWIMMKAPRLFRSQDFGINWDLCFYDYFWVTKMFSFQSNQYLKHMGLIYVSYDHGNSWNYWPLCTRSVSDFLFTEPYLYIIADAPTNFYRSANGGLGWQQLYVPDISESYQRGLLYCSLRYILYTSYRLDFTLN